MNTPIIEVKNISKKYGIAHERGGYVTLRDVLMNVLRRPFSFLKTKAKRIVGLEKKEEFWALKDINFSVNKAEIVGVIGANGAGKSTLLKILSQITPPTEGEIILRGKVGSLLEVGTGFHPELTGRENIFLNGAILGMGRQEIAKKFDDIVEFSGIGKFLDTPVKYYSSGMYVRLAFSIAAHMESDILLVDEVLAVGDAEFQKKCLGKMEEVTKKEGRTIVFVSHNMAAIQNLCSRSILIEKGQVALMGETSEVVDKYLSKYSRPMAVYNFKTQNTKVSIEEISILDNGKSLTSAIPISNPFKIQIDFIIKEDIKNAILSTLFYSQDQDLILYSSDSDTTGKFRDYKAGNYTASVEIPSFLFNVGNYTFDVYIHTPSIESFGQQKNMAFEITNINNPRTTVFSGGHSGKIATPLIYKINSN